MWRILNEEEVKEFRVSARDNFHGGDINSTWHPVYQAECHLINYETTLIAAEMYTTINT